ncbi:MAG: TOBE domain-containing protein [Capsulimonadaceae bacterium]|nr:TOBE domain-containing protein [Capsulimonadaceae bacterium]
MKISARNVLTGVVKSVTPGIVNAEVVLELPSGQEIVSVVTKSSVERLGITVGKPVSAIIKSSDVLLGVD